MHLTSLILTNFRNYDALSLSLSGQSVVLVGRNGAGKTNLLEAVSFLAPGRGVRRAALGDVAKQGKDGSWAVAAEIMTQQGIVQIGTGAQPSAASGGKGIGEKRIVKIDGKIIRGQKELAKLVSVLWLTPQMDGLFLGSDSDRRRFLDRLAYSFDPDHADHVSAYEKAMRQRNQLLQEPGSDTTWLSALEQQMAEHGMAVGKARLATTLHLNKSIMAADFSFPKARITLSGFMEDRLQQSMTEQQIVQDAMGRLQASRALDGAAGRLTFGLHRSVMQVWFDIKNMEAGRCSTGEQKALLLSIILGQARAVKEGRGAAPLLLLDEVVAHLDAYRRAELCALILDLGSQAWMTGTDAGFFSDLQGNSTLFDVTEGQVKVRSSAV